MRKFTLMIVAALCAAGVNAQRFVPRSVQGVPYEAGSYSELRPLSVLDGQFSFDMIESWAGEGDNSAALVIQWNTGKDNVALVFGYHWDGQATGADMVKAVAAANPGLYTLIQYTNVSSPTDPDGGYTINGFGWDADGDGDIHLKDTKDGKIYDSEDGVFIHPRGYVPGQGGSSDYDYDDWVAVDADDWWQAGWLSNGFWSYWVKSSTADKFSFSGVGASGRVLTDGCWDGWNFEPGFSLISWMPFEAAPSPIPADAKTRFNHGGICYTLKNYAKKSVEVSAPFELDGVPAPIYSGEVTIPESFVDEDVTYTVVGIGQSAFQGSSVTKVTLPMTVTEIGSMAFESSMLSDINLSDAIKKIGSYAFMLCPVTTAYFPSSISEVAEGLYYGSSVTSAVIPSHVVSLGDNAFGACAGLTEISLPATLKSVGSGAFGDCDAVNSVRVYATYPLSITDDVFGQTTYANASLIVPQGFSDAYSAAPGWKNFSKKDEFAIEVKDGDRFMSGGVTYAVTSVDNASVKVTYCRVENAKPSVSEIRSANKSGYVGDVVVPQTIVYQGKSFTVTELNDTVFCGATEMKSVMIPSSVSEIPCLAFDGCSKLSSVSLPENIKTIGDYAFRECAAMEVVHLPQDLTAIGKYAFYGCSSLRAIAVPDGVTVLPQYAFKGCSSLQSVTYGENVRTLEMYLFSGCSSLTDVKIPEGMTSLPQALFENCSSLVSVTIPPSVTSFGNYVFDGCSNLVMDIPSQVTKLGGYSFRKCISLQSVNVPDGITELPNYVFSGCTALGEVSMSDNVKTIGNYAFAGCSALERLDLVDVTPGMRAEGTGVRLPSKLAKIGPYAFQNCKLLDFDPEMPASLTTIGNYAFSGASLLGRISLPEALTSIGQRAFENTSLKSLVIPPKVKSFSSSADMVYGCADIKIYLTNPVPVSVTANAFRIATGKNAPVYVLSGTKADYDAKSSIWKKIDVKEPELAVEFGDLLSSAGMTECSLSASMSVDYADVDLPARFVQANEHNLSNGKVEVLYKIKDSDDTELSAVANIGEDNSVTAQLTDLLTETVYVYNWKYVNGTTEAVSPESEFVTRKDLSGVDSVSAGGSVACRDGRLVISGFEGAAVSVYTISGSEVITFRCDGNMVVSDRCLEKGMYVVCVKSVEGVISIKVVI